MDNFINFNEELIIKGTWWLHEANKIQGQIEYIPNQKLQLKITSSLIKEGDVFFETIIDDGAGNYKKIKPDNSSKTICGIDENNTPITLLNCFVTSQKISSKEPKITTYIIQYAIFGLHIKSIDELLFSKMRFRVGGLKQFLGTIQEMCSSRTNLLNKDLTVKEFFYKGFNVKSIFHLGRNGQSHSIDDETALSQIDFFIEISNTRICSYTEYIDILDAYRDLIILALNNSTSIDSIEGYNSDCKVNILFSSQYEYKLKIDTQIFSISDINSDIVENWYKIYFSNRNILRTFCSTIQNENGKRLYINNKFFNYVSVFEGLHRTIFEQKFISINEDAHGINVKEKIKNIIKQINDLKNSLLKSNFKYLPSEVMNNINFDVLSWTLKRRLLHTFSEFEYCFDQVDKEKVANYIKDTRNDIAHASSELKFNGIELYRHNLILRKMIYLLITKEIGLPNKSVERINTVFKTYSDWID